MHRIAAVTLALGLLSAAGLGAPGHAATNEEQQGDQPKDYTFPTAYDVDVADVSAKVGQSTVMHARLKIRDGYRILHAYNNRVVMLSAEDNGVAFERKSFLATADGNELDFDIALKPTAPGTHPINGVFRVGYIEGTDSFSMVSMKLIAKVTGTP